MFSSFPITYKGHALTIQIATTQEEHSHYSEHPEELQQLVKDIRNVLRNVPTLVVK